MGAARPSRPIGRSNNPPTPGSNSSYLARLRERNAQREALLKSGTPYRDLPKELQYAGRYSGRNLAQTGYERMLGS